MNSSYSLEIELSMQNNHIIEQKAVSFKYFGITFVIEIWYTDQTGVMVYCYY